MQLFLLRSIAGWFTGLFAWKGFLISTRLSYAIYLTQFPVFFFNVGQTRTAENYGFFRMLVIIYLICNTFRNLISSMFYRFFISVQLQRIILDRSDIGYSHASLRHTFPKHKESSSEEDAHSNVYKIHQSWLKRSLRYPRQTQEDLLFWILYIVCARLSLHWRKTNIGSSFNLPSYTMYMMAKNLFIYYVVNHRHSLFIIIFPSKMIFPFPFIR